MKNQIQLYVAIFAVCLLSAVTAVASYAFIGAPTVNANITTQVNIDPFSDDSVDVTFAGATTLSLSVTAAKLPSDLSTTHTDSTTISPTVTLTHDASYTKGLKCVVKAYYIASTVYTPSSASCTNPCDELVLYTSTNGTNLTQSSITSTLNIAGLAKDSKTLIWNGYVKTAAGATSATGTFNFYLRFNNKNYDQSGALGQTPGGTIKFESGECTVA